MAWKEDIRFDFSKGIYRARVANSPLYPDGYAWDLFNMVYERDAAEPQKMGGYEQLGSTDMGGAVNGLFDYAEGTRLIATTTDGLVYEYAGSDFAQAANGSGFSTEDKTRWSGAMFYGATTAANLLILCSDDDGDAPQKYISSTGVSALAGSPPAKGKFPVSWLGRLWLAADDTLFASKVNDAEVWLVASGGANVQVDRGSGPIVGMVVYMNHLLIFKRDRLYHIAPESTLEAQSVWQISSSVGGISHYTIKPGAGDYDGFLFYLSDNGVMALTSTDSTGGFKPRSITESVKVFFDTRNKSSPNTTWATFNEDRAEYWVQFPEKGSTGTPSSGLIGNAARYHRGQIRWTRHNLPNMTAGTIYRSDSEQRQVLGDTHGRVYQLHSGEDRNGAAYLGRFLTAAMQQGAPHRIKRYGRTFIDVASKADYPITVRLNIGRKGMAAPEVGNETQITDFSTVQGWGEVDWGVGRWAGGGLGGRFVRADRVARGRYMRVLIETTGNDQFFKMDGLVQEYDYRARMIA